MVALFKERSPATVLWLFLLSVVVHSHFFVGGLSVHANPTDGLLSAFLQNHLAGLNLSALLLLYHAVVVLQALQLNYLFSNQRMYSKNTFLPAMVYILLTGLFAEWSNITAPLLINSLIIWLFAKAVRLYNTPNPKTLLFDIGFLIGIGTLLYHPFAILIPVIFFAALMVRPFAPAELLTFIMGVVAPYYFLTAYLYFTDQFPSILNYLPRLFLNLFYIKPTPLLFTTLGALVVILLTGIYYWQQENRRLLIQVRKNWVILLVMLIFLLPVPFINVGVGLESLLLWIVPAAPFMAAGFLVPKRNTWPALMFWLLLGLCIATNWQLLR